MDESIFITENNERLSRQLRFTAEIDKMTSIMRRTLLVDGSRTENDAEHSWHIAVMALLFEEYALQKPDIGHAVKMLVCHDLIEIYAGDTFAYDVEANKNKEAREKAAADRLFSQLPEEQGAEIRSLWEEFDAVETTDSKYANCMDRVQPFLHNLLTEGHTWRNGGAKRYQIEQRMGIIKEFMPEVYKWIQKSLDESVAKGWLTE